MIKMEEITKVTLTDDVADDSCWVTVYSGNKKASGRYSYHRKDDVEQLEKLVDLKNKGVEVIYGWTDGYNGGIYNHWRV